MGKDKGLPDPDFEYARSSLVVTLRKTKLTEQYLKDANLSKRQVSAFEHMKKGLKMTSIEYAKMFGVTDRTARNDLSVMAEKGLVKKVGAGDRNTAYVLAEI